MVANGASLRLRPQVALDVIVADDTPFGSPLSTSPDDNTRRLFSGVLERVTRSGVDGLLADGPGLLADAVAHGVLSTVADDVDDTGWRLRPDVLYPDVHRVRPAAMAARDSTGHAVVFDVVDDSMWPDIHRLIAALSDGTGGQSVEIMSTHERSLYDELLGAGFLEASDQGVERDASLIEPGLTFLGHNSVVVRSASTTVVVDPYLLPCTDEPSAYRPLRLAEIGPLDAVVVTHSHPDHFSLGTLLQLPPDTLLLVPEVARETILSVAMAARLRQLGFTRVIELRWGDHAAVGDIEVHALPFLGEQPTDGKVLHPEVRNAGNVYVVRTPDLSVAMLADSGRDALGDVKDVALLTQERLGPVDVVFSGYRGWHAYPVQHLFSSVARYFLFVPPALWGSRMQLMNDIDDALDVAERWGSRLLVPYADGGAPWFWERGLGPRLDHDRHEIAGVDPFPERVAEAARHRIQAPDGQWLSAPLDVVVLRPNESLVNFGHGGGPEWRRIATNEWPYA